MFENDSKFNNILRLVAAIAFFVNIIISIQSYYDSGNMTSLMIGIVSSVGLIITIAMFVKNKKQMKK